jgi:hypothetical protein
MIGAEVTYFGLAEADGRVRTPSAYDGTTPIFTKSVGQGFLIVVEARPGISGRPVGEKTFNWSPTDPNRLPDVQIVVSRPLGDGSTDVCDVNPGDIGGVPAIDPPAFSGTQQVADALNDFGCRFSFTRSSGSACTRNSVTLDFQFAASNSTAQFCTSTGVGSEIGFPAGDTRLTVRVRDDRDQPGQTAALIVRVQP